MKPTIVKNPIVKKIYVEKEVLNSIHRKYTTDYIKNKELENDKIPNGMYIITNFTKDFSKLEKIIDNYFEKHLPDVPRIALESDASPCMCKFFDHVLKQDKMIYEIMSNFITSCLKLTNIKPMYYKKYINSGSFRILRYKSNTGLRQHVDNPYDHSGPTFTLSLGTDYTLYDMIPYKELLHKYNPVRVYIKRGDLVIIDSDARFGYTHGLPNNNIYTDGKRFSINFLLTRLEDSDQSLCSPEIISARCYTNIKESKSQDEYLFDI